MNARDADDVMVDATDVSSLLRLLVLDECGKLLRSAWDDDVITDCGLDVSVEFYKEMHGPNVILLVNLNCA